MTPVFPILAISIVIILILSIFWGNTSGSEVVNTVESIKDTFNQNKVGRMNPLTNKLSTLLFFSHSWMHNGSVNKEEDIHTACSQVESNYQRRADLIPNLVEIISKYLQQEKTTIEGVTTERNSGKPQHNHTTKVLSNISIYYLSFLSNISSNRRDIK